MNPISQLPGLISRLYMRFSPRVFVCLERISKLPLPLGEGWGEGPSSGLRPPSPKGRRVLKRILVSG